MEYYDKEAVEALKKNMEASPEFWHKVMNPYCPVCLYERGKALIEGREKWGRAIF
jgi:hypothetical protein